MIEASELIAGVFGALLTGAGKLVSDWRTKSQSREAYLASIQTEMKCLSELIESQQLVSKLSQMIQVCEGGDFPSRRPKFDFGQNYFSCFETLGSDFRFLKKDECETVVTFYMLTKAAFDTVKVDGPLQREEDLSALAQMCRFLLSILAQISMLNATVQNFSSKRKTTRAPRLFRI